LALTRNNLALAHDYRGEIAGNADAFRQARADLERVVAEHPENASFRSALGLICRNQGEDLAYRSQPVEALETLARSVSVLQTLVRENPEVHTFRIRLLASCTSYAKWLTASGRSDAALDVLRPALEIVDAELARDPGSLIMLDNRAAILIETGFALARKHEAEPALRAIERAIVIDEALVAKTEDPSTVFELACAYSLKAELLASDSAAPGRKGERRQADDTAIDRLRQFVSLGYRTRCRFVNDPQLDAVRCHPAFQALLMDLDFPADPFAH
jgi:tetratricopeptide (TPR) repeat protein